MNDAGRFIKDGRSFEITGRPPAPWSHVLTNGEFGSVWTERGGVFCWCGNSVLDRLTRWDQDLVLNPSRRYVYLLDETGIVRTLTPSPLSGDATWRVEYGPGFATYEGTCAKYRTRFDAVVLPGMNAEVWYAEVTPVGSAPKELRLVSVQDVLMGTWPDVHREFHKLFIRTAMKEGSRTKPGAKTLVFTKELDTRPGVKEHWNCVFPGALANTSSGEIRGFETDRLAFYGYAGSLENPARLAEAPRAGSTGAWGDATSILDVAAQPGKVVAFATSYGPSIDEAVEIGQQAMTVTREEAITSIQKFWREQVGALSTETPSKDLDLMASHWLRYQTIAGRLMARCGLYQASGAFGFRDQLQDCMIFLPYATERTHAQLTMHLEHQFTEGDVLHWWHPQVDVGPRDNCSDDYLWPILVAAELYRETGSAAFLDQPVKFMNGPATPVWDHLRRSVDRALSKRSKRNLPLLGSCDWNDGLSSAGDKNLGESVWVGHFQHLLFLEMAELARARGEDPSPFIAMASEIRKVVNAEGWDGSWFIQGTNDEGALIGSSKCREGQIHLNAQTWSVIGRTAALGEQSGTREDQGELKFGERAVQAMEAVKKRLVVEWGVLLLTPAYATPDSSIGYITRYAPGARENGGVYTHGAVWTARAARMLGDKELLRHVIFSLLPPVRGRDPRYRAEPYVTPGNIDGPTTPTPGKGGWTWYTGSSGWLVRCIYEDLLGIRSVPDGLVLQPNVDSDWSKFTVERPWRGKRLKLQFERGAKPGLTVNGRDIAGTKLPWSALGAEKEITVKVIFA